MCKTIVKVSMEWWDDSGWRQHCNIECFTGVKAWQEGINKATVEQMWWWGCPICSDFLPYIWVWKRAVRRKSTISHVTTGSLLSNLHKVGEESCEWCCYELIVVLSVVDSKCNFASLRSFGHLRGRGETRQGGGPSHSGYTCIHLTGGQPFYSHSYTLTGIALSSTSNNLLFF